MWEHWADIVILLIILGMVGTGRADPGREETPGQILLRMQRLCRLSEKRG